MATPAHAVLVLGALVTLFCVNALMPATLYGAALIGVWLLLPYALLALGLRFLARDPRAMRTYASTAMAVSIGGVLFLTDVIYLRPDAQGAIAVMFTPIYQMIATGVLVPALGWWFGRSPS